jgi:hypothetical protein
VGDYAGVGCMGKTPVVIVTTVKAGLEQTVKK